MLAKDFREKMEIFNVSNQRIATLFEGAVNAREQQNFEFNPAVACNCCMYIYCLQTEQGSYYGNAVIVMVRV